MTDPDGSTTQTATVDSNGNWTVTIPSSQASGGVSATQTDGTTTSSATTAAYDAIDPSLTITTAAEGTISGTGTPGDTINYTITVSTGSGSSTTGSSTTVGADGTWTANAGNSASGTLKVISAATNETATSPYTVSSITLAAAGTVSGTGVAGNTVTVTDPDGMTTQTTTVASSGTWSVTIPSTQASGTVNAVFSDGAQKSAAYVTSIPLTITTAADGTISGTGTPGDTISYTITTSTGASSTDSAVVAQNGTWTSHVMMVNSSGTLTVTDTSSTAMATGLYIVSSITRAAGGTVSGTGVPGNTVTVTDPDNVTTQTTTVASDGTWSVTVPASQTHGTVIAHFSDNANPAATYIQNPANTTITYVDTSGATVLPSSTVSLTGEVGASATVPYSGSVSGYVLAGVTYNGTAVKPGSTITLTANGVLVYTYYSANNESINFQTSASLPSSYSGVPAMTVFGSLAPGYPITITYIDKATGATETKTIYTDASGNYSYTLPTTPLQESHVLVSQTLAGATYQADFLVITSNHGETAIASPVKNADGTYSISDTVTLHSLSDYPINGGDAVTLTGNLVDTKTGAILATVTKNGTLDNVTTDSTVILTYTLTAAQYAALIASGDTVQSQVTGVDNTQATDMIPTGITSWDAPALQMDKTYANESETMPTYTPSGATTIESATKDANGTYTVLDTVTLKGGIAGDSFNLSGKLVDLTTASNLSGVTATATGTFATDGTSSATLSYTLTAAQYGLLTTHGDTIESQVAGSDAQANTAITVDPTYANEALAMPLFDPSGATTIGNATENANGTYTVLDTVTLQGGIPGDTYSLSGNLVDLTTRSNLSGVTATATGTFASDGTSSVELAYTLTNAQYDSLIRVGDQIQSQVAGIDTTDLTTLNIDPTFTNESENIAKYTPSASTILGTVMKTATGYTLVDTVTLTGGLSGDTFNLSGNLVDITTKTDLMGVTAITTGNYDASGNATATLTYNLTPAQYGSVTSNGDSLQSQVSGTTATGNTLISFDPTYASESQRMPTFKPNGATQISSAAKNADGTYTIDDTVTLKGGMPADQFSISGNLIDLTTGSNLSGGKATATGTFASDGTSSATLVYILTADQYESLTQKGDTIQSQVTGTDTTDSTTLTIDLTYFNESETIPPVTPTITPKVNTSEKVGKIENYYAPNNIPAFPFSRVARSNHHLPATGSTSENNLVEIGTAFLTLASVMFLKEKGRRR
ncbi:hypothetical protein RT41_GL000529 [Lactococcus fujiensis JCM 16395]|uniref:Gram-positive cocci surface proteins LPxTG domain-containing protein n=1 Tax=Lactococcus fujiensis JCM 16395 TaxID=1291764 RepID=A0A2A5RIV2_9LACT|nr:hypothetical protein RT41_GL000529 [Lactococcus fujiensis JCM 16395]